MYLLIVQHTHGVSYLLAPSMIKCYMMVADYIDPDTILAIWKPKGSILKTLV